MKLTSLLLLVLFAFPSLAQVIKAELVTIEDVTMEGITFTGLDDPTMNSNGTVAVVGISNNSLDDFIFVHDSIFFKGSDSTNAVFDLFENQCGIDAMDHVMFMAEENGINGIYRSDLGRIIAEDDVAPGYPITSTINFLYRPHMLDDGSIYFIASVDETGNGTSDSRALYKSDPVTGVVTLQLTSNDPVSGQALTPGSTGYDLDFDVSENESNTIIVGDLNTGSTLNDACVVMNGAIIAQEATTSVGIGEFLDQFDFVRVNNQGDYIITGDTDGAIGTDEYMYVNGAIQIREGDVLDGITLSSTASVNGIDMNNNRDVAFVWGTAGAQEYLFSGNLGDPNGLADASMILKRYDSIDVDGDFEWDYYITDFNCLGGYRGFELKDTNVLYINVDLRDTANIEREAIIKIDPFCRPTRNTLTMTPCHNDTLLIGGASVTASGIYFDTTAMSGTCMSIDRYMVDYFPEPAMGQASAVICSGDSILIGGNYFSQPGTYYPVLSSLATGCDSIVQVQIANLPTYAMQETYTLCQGDSLFAGGSFQTTSGVYTDTLLSQYFCDSVVTKDVSFVTEFNTPISYSLCAGDSILLGGAYQFNDGTYHDTLSAAFGCDSILVQTVTFNALPTVILDTYPVDSICADGAPIALPDGLPAGGTYSGNGVTGSTFDPALTGLLGESFLYYTYTDNNGCVNTDETSIVVYDCYLGLEELRVRVVVYPNPSSGIFHVNLSEEINSAYRVISTTGREVTRGVLAGNTLEIDLSAQTPGYYYLEIEQQRFKLVKAR